MQHIRPWLLQDLREGWRTSPARVILVLTAVGTGTLTLTLLLAVLGGLRLQAGRLAADFGANAAILELDHNNRPALTHSHLNTLRAQFPSATWIGERAYGPQSIPGLGRITLYAATPGWETARGLPLLSGRPLDPADADQHRAYALASSDLGLAPGDRLRIHQTEFTLVGITGPGRFLLIPHTLRGDWEDPEATTHLHRIRLIQTQPDPEPLFRQIRQFFAHEAPQANLHLITPEQLLAETRRLSRILRHVLGTVTLLALLLGGSTLASLMVQNVRQRRREIGLRMAIGARQRDIFILFLLEGLLLSTFAAFIGICIGAHLLQHVPAEVNLPLHSGAAVLAPPLLLAAAIGGIFSCIPARIATRLVPAQALRCED